MSGIGKRLVAISGALLHRSGILLTLPLKHPGKAALCLALLLVLGVAWAFLDNRENIFTVDALTEIVSVETSGEAFSGWLVGGGRLLENPLASSDTARALPPDTYLMIQSGTLVTVQRHGIRAVRIRLENPGASVGTLDVPGDPSVALGGWAVVLVTPESSPLILPFRGRLTVGDDVTSGVDSILLSGSVGVLEEQWIPGSRYNAGTTVLDRGDKIRFVNEVSEHETEQAIVDGFLRVEPVDQERFTEAINGIQLMAHGVASYVKVERLGSTGYQIMAHRWARFLYDPLLAFLAALGALLFAAAEVYSRSREIFLQLGGKAS